MKTNTYITKPKHNKIDKYFKIANVALSIFAAFLLFTLIYNLNDYRSFYDYEEAYILSSLEYKEYQEVYTRATTNHAISKKCSANETELYHIGCYYNATLLYNGLAKKEPELAKRFQAIANEHKEKFPSYQNVIADIDSSL